MKESKLILAGTEYTMISDKAKKQAIADWFQTYYSHTTNDKTKIEKVEKKAKGSAFLEEGNTFYLLP